MPRIWLAYCLTSSFDLATLTPPPLPRPPAWICALTTHTLPPSDSAAAAASSTEKQGTPRGVVTPNFLRISLPWYSWIFMRLPSCLEEINPKGLSHAGSAPVLCAPVEREKNIACLTARTGRGGETGAGLLHPEGWEQEGASL